MIRFVSEIMVLFFLKVSAEFKLSGISGIQVSQIAFLYLKMNNETF